MLVRHGKTLGNKERRFIGSGTDEGLCAEGATELEVMTKSGIYSAFTPEIVYSSSMRRCLESANIIFSKSKIVPVENLHEMHFGDFEGLTHAEIILRPGCANFGIDEEHMDFPGGEGYRDFSARCLEAFNGLLSKEQHSFAIVLHGGVIMAIMQELFGGDMYGYSVMNGKGYLLTLGENKEWLTL